MTLNQALLNMHFALANGKGVQLDAEQTAAVLALIESQSQSLDRLSAEIDMLREAYADHAFESDLCSDDGDKP